MRLRKYRTTLCALLLLVASVTAASGQKPRINRPVSAIPTNVLLGIMRAEDERRWDNTLPVFFLDKDPKVRKRAALAMGRIGDDRALPALIEVLKTESDDNVRQMIAFAIGEIESPDGAAALIEVLDDTRAPAEIRARAVEALGKIGGALLSSAPRDQKEPKPVDERLTRIRTAILDALKFEAGRRSMSDRETVLLGLTAVLRTRPDGAGPVVAHFLKYSDSRIVADALNTMARLRLKDGSDQVRQLLGSGDAVVRANAARVCGANEDKQAFDALLARALYDYDVRVRVSAIRALGSLKDARAAGPLLDRGAVLWTDASKSGVTDRDNKLMEVLEIATTLGRVLPISNSEKAMTWFGKLRDEISPTSPEVEVAFARVAPQFYMIQANLTPGGVSRSHSKLVLGRSQSSVAQGLAELAAAKTGEPILDASIKETATGVIRMAFSCTTYRPSPRWMRPKPGDVVSAVGQCVPLQSVALPEFLRAYAAFKTRDLTDLLQKRITDQDVIIRATSAELLGEQPPNEANARALVAALPVALRDRDLNDAALAILGALAKRKSAAANDAIKTALDSSDHLVRRRAVALLKANGIGDSSNRIGTVHTRNTEADYRRAIRRIGKHVTATVVTSKGSFTIEFLPEDAPLTVDNFITLARKGFFNGQTIPRVVPNFVIQGGDPRGDGNGGPGYSIRCEINEVPYERAAVGMALSGKDTGGSQWFVTHSPQPHLDGGYTVFGRVIRGMDVVDSIARGDTIRRVTVIERSSGIR